MARKRPYTLIGIKRLKCYRCSNKASSQWNVCADGGIFRPLCRSCDIELNRMVLDWMGDNKVEEKIRKYNGASNIGHGS